MMEEIALVNILEMEKFFTHNVNLELQLCKGKKPIHYTEMPYIVKKVEIIGTNIFEVSCRNMYAKNLLFVEIVPAKNRANEQVIVKDRIDFTVQFTIDIQGKEYIFEQKLRHRNFNEEETQEKKHKHMSKQMQNELLNFLNN